MTEREYVQAIKAAAERYHAEFQANDKSAVFGQVGRRWENIKAHLAPSTAIALCDAWLKAKPEDGNG